MKNTRSPAKIKPQFAIWFALTYRLTVRAHLPINPLGKLRSPKCPVVITGREVFRVSPGPARPLALGDLVTA